jgi:hypothetical protein
MKDDRVLREVEESLEVLYNSEGFWYLSEIEIKSLEDKRRIIHLEKEKEGDLRVGHCGYQLGMRTQNSFMSLQIVERI